MLTLIQIGPEQTSCRGAVAQSVERRSKGPMSVQPTDMGSNPGRAIR